MKCFFRVLAAIIGFLGILQPAFAAKLALFGLPTFVTGVAGSTVNINARIRNAGDQNMYFDTEFLGISIDRIAPGEPPLEPFEIADSFQFFAEGEINPFLGLVLAPGEDFDFVLGRTLLPMLYEGAASTSIVHAGFVFDGNYDAPSWVGLNLIVGVGPTSAEGPFQFVGAPSGVPEPESWLVMILGFSFVGVALRYRRASGNSSPLLT